MIKFKFPLLLIFLGIISVIVLSLIFLGQNIKRESREVSVSNSTLAQAENSNLGAVSLAARSENIIVFSPRETDAVVINLEFRDLK